jgi:hypothetical protein
MTSVTTTNSNFYDSPDSQNWVTPYRLTVDPLVSFPIDRDPTAQVFRENWIQNADSYSPETIGVCHPTITTDITGLISIENGTSTITGVDTIFNVEFLVGDYIVLSGEKYIVDTITSPTEMTIETPFASVTLVDANAQRSKLYLTKEDGHNFEEDGLLRWDKIWATVPSGRIDYQNLNFTFPAFKNLTADATTTRAKFSQTVIAENSFSYIRTNAPVQAISINPIFTITSGGVAVNAVAQDTVPTLSTYQGYVSTGATLQAQETRLSNYMGNIWQTVDARVYAK